jgi:hypothetical protein
LRQNLGLIERTLRFVIGVALIALALLGLVGAWGWAGLVLVLTAVMGWCPAYFLARRHCEPSC